MPPKYARWAAQLDAVVAQCEQWAIDGRTVANVSRNLLPAYITARGLDVAFLKAKAAGVAVDDDIPNACVEGYLLGRGKP